MVSLNGPRDEANSFAPMVERHSSYGKTSILSLSSFVARLEIYDHFVQGDPLHNPTGHPKETTGSLKTASTPQEVSDSMHEIRSLTNSHLGLGAKSPLTLRDFLSLGASHSSALLILTGGTVSTFAGLDLY
jgi:hypothetical protein